MIAHPDQGVPAGLSVLDQTGRVPEIGGTRRRTLEHANRPTDEPASSMTLDGRRHFIEVFGGFSKPLSKQVVAHSPRSSFARSTWSWSSNSTTFRFHCQKGCRSGSRSPSRSSFATRTLSTKS